MGRRRRVYMFDFIALNPYRRLSQQGFAIGLPALTGGLLDVEP